MNQNTADTAEHDDLVHGFCEEFFELAQEYHEKGLSRTSLRVNAKETIEEVHR